MEMFKKWLPTGLLVIAGIIAISLGFAAAFAPINGSSVKEVYEVIPPLFGTTIISHLGMAYVGGVTTGVLGVISLIAASIIWYKTHNDELDGNKIILAISIIVFVISLVLGIAAIICNSELNNETWMQGQITKVMVSKTRTELIEFMEKMKLFMKLIGVSV